MPLKFLLALLIAAAVGAAYMLLRPAADAPMPVTGIYAEDWAARCGALHGAEQSTCTARLDAAYGRVAGAPVPTAR